MVVAERNRLGTATGAVRPHIEAHIAWLEQQLRQTLRQRPGWCAKDDLLRSVPGYLLASGQLTAFTEVAASGDLSLLVLDLDERLRQFFGLQ